MQKAKINEEYSSWEEILLENFQGPILGPPLFLLFAIMMLIMDLDDRDNV